MESVNYNEIIDKSSLVALASPKETKYSIRRKIRWDKLTPDERKKVKEDFKKKNPKKTFYAPSFKTGKLPAYSWRHSPREYKGYDDIDYGSAVLCNFIPEYGYYLAVIDLDSPKEDNDIPMDDLLKVCDKWITTTHTRKTPSGGYHIYLLSKTKPELKQPSFNIDYQTNTGKLKGKYVVCNYRYGIKINDEIIDLDKYYKKNQDIEVSDMEFFKEYYTKVPESSDDILVVNSTDEILSEILSEIERLGLWTPPAKKKVKLVEHSKNVKTKEDKKELVSILRNYVREGIRDELAKSVSGYLYKKGFTHEKCLQIFKEVFREDEELDHRLDLLERTFDKPKKDVAGISALRNLLSPRDVNRVKSIVEKQKKPKKKEIDFNVIDIDERIAYYLEYDYGVTDKMIIESIEKNSTLFFEPTSLNYYVKNGNDSIELINELFVINHCNNLFGANEISKKQCERALNFVTRFIKKEPYVLEFSNGLLCINIEDNTFRFLENVYSTNFIPKVKFPFKWNPEANGGEIEKSVNMLLKTNKKGFENNINNFFKSVGHSCMGAIEKGIITIIIGKPGSGKSTLLTMLKRIFTYSEVSVPEIIKNERFALTPVIGKDVNIDDDLQSDVWKGIGKLNTFITGNGGNVEIKGENARLQLTTYNTPKLWGASNALPPVIGDGFERRLNLLLVENIIPPEKVNDSFQMNILNGLHDNELEWLIYMSISRYMDERDKPFVEADHKQAMVNEHKFKSDPLKSAIDYIFKDSETSNLEVKVVNREIKNWFKYAIKTGKIFDEHKRPSAQQINKAMGRAGYFKGKSNGYDDDGQRHQYAIYEDITLNRDWQTLYKMFLGEGNEN